MRVVVIAAVIAFVGAAAGPAWAAPTIEAGGENKNGNDVVNIDAHDRAERRSDYSGTPSQKELKGVPASSNPAPVEQITSCGMPTQDICDNSVATPRPLPDRADPATVTSVARDYFRSIPMPVPQPVISAPNGGITGAVHSLDLRVDPEVVFRDPVTQFGPLTLHVYGRFTVDWGDGTRNTYTSAGAPFPNSAITHTWTDTGRYTITVTANWTADWSLDGYQGTLGGLRTTATIPSWPVIELQAVITD